MSLPIFHEGPRYAVAQTFGYFHAVAQKCGTFAGLAPAFDLLLFICLDDMALADDLRTSRANIDRRAEAVKSLDQALSL